MNRKLTTNLQDWIDQESSQNIEMKPSFHQKYHNLDEIRAFYADLVAKYPDLCEEFSIGKSYEGRAITGIRIHGKRSISNTTLLFHAGIHSREWIGPAMITWISDTLLSSYGVNQNMTDLLDAFTFEIIPVLNVDGYVFTHNGNRY